MKKLAFIATAALAATQLFAVPGSISTANDTKSGDIKWNSRSKVYEVAIKKGKAVMNTEVPLADMTSLDIPKPAMLDKAVEMVQSGKGAAAIAPLTKIVADYKMLVWDKPAGRWLVEAYLAANNAQKALDTANQIASDDPTAKFSGDLAPAYWHALMKTGKTQQLENCLRKAASCGSRPASADALIMRGDMILAGDESNPDKIRAALTDGYLRVALMYTDEPCKGQRQTAMLRAAKCFSTLGQASRAEDLKSKANAL